MLPCFADADSRTVRCLRSASTQLTAPWPFSRTDTCSLAVHWIPVGLALHAAQSGPAVAAVAVHQLSELQADALDLENGSVGIVAERTERCASTSARLGSWCRHTGGHCHSGLFTPSIGGASSRMIEADGGKLSPGGPNGRPRQLECGPRILWLLCSACRQRKPEPNCT